MQQQAWTPVILRLIEVAGLVLTAIAIVLSVWLTQEKRNADLVKIGIDVLRVDPQKEKDVSEATREWALNLIDANAGGVKFSEDARATLLKKPLWWGGGDGWGKITDGYLGGGDITNGYVGKRTIVDGYSGTQPGPTPPRPSGEKPK